MVEIQDADDYEKKFLENYIRKQADNKIKKLQEKINQTVSVKTRNELDDQIKNILADLQISLRNLENTEDEKQINLNRSSEIIAEDSDNMFFTYIKFKIPTNIWNYLFDYQKEGIKWMIDLYVQKKGGILADEMGLGKTIQAVTFILAIISANKDAKILILCPATLVDQWSDEFKKLNCKQNFTTIGSNQINIMSYELFRTKGLTYEYELAILDEGHKIKNRHAQITYEVKKINCKSRFVLTGTPIQNNLSELWSIFDFVNPNILGSYNTFKDEFEENIGKSNNDKQKSTSYRYSVMLRSIIEPFILRRLKSQIKHMLPDKADKVIFLQLSDIQKSLYIKTLESKRFEKLKATMFRSKEGVLGAISYLRKICNHPILVSYHSYDDFDNKKSNIGENKLQFEDSNNNTYFSMILSSCKMKSSFELLDQWFCSQNKALIFFQTVQMLKIFERALKLLKPEFSYYIMTGDTPVKSRQTLIHDFNMRPEVFIFLLTTKVGGYGLNLTGANRIIIFDPDWNPSSDNQAKERIYRFGQQSNVEIYRFVCKGTIEERIYEKQIYKDCLSKKILLNPDVSFKKKYFFDLFSYYNNFCDTTEELTNNKIYSDKNDEILSVKEEDRRDFTILKRYNSQLKLNGQELIEYIERRECNLQE